MLPLVQATRGAAFRLTYKGPVGVAGAGVTQTWDLTLFSPAVRQSATFKQNLLIFARQGTAGLMSVSDTIAFVDDAEGVPIALELTLSAAAITDVIGLDVWFLHSITGAVCTQSQLYFVNVFGGGGGAVASVFGRVGAVVAALGDYAASLVSNDSGVAGATVKDALNNLAAAIPAVPVTSVFGRVGAVAAALGDYAASLVSNDSGVAGATVKDALNNLAAAIPVVPVTSVFGRVGAVAAASGDYTSTLITNSSAVSGTTVTDALNTLDQSINYGQAYAQSLHWVLP